ncbi:MAG TPA: cysteine synthase A [Desulfotignum sp.]|nr:cysteine synthase A [Desulfotignum sp.]
MKKLPDITAACGNTPLVYLNKASQVLNAAIYGKLEYFNPLSSVKDRIGPAMIQDALDTGKINQDTIIVEPTSGNTGIALAFVCRVKGLQLILTMPETMSIERRQLLTHLGAQLHLTEGKKGMKGAIEAAKKLVETMADAYMPDQFSNPANPAIHRTTTGPEIWDALDGSIDIFVAGVGTGGTITGVSEMIKQKKPHLLSVAVEPEKSPVLSGGNPGPHKIQGIGAGFIPANLNLKIVDEIVTVSEDNAFANAKELAKDYGMLCGISSGANFHAAKQMARQHPGKTVVFIVCDTGERYISTPLFQA